MFDGTTPLVRYVCRFSDLDCWSGDHPPGPGDTLYVPRGYNLLVDVDTVPDLENADPEDPEYLTAVIVEGALIFESN